MKEVLFLSGGGNETDSKQLDDKFVESMKERDGIGIAYIPVALPVNQFAKAFEWFNSVFQNRAGKIEMWTEFKNKTKDDISTISSIYVGGGDTVKLLNAFQESGFDNVLKAYIKDGGIVYGGSAGAIILGKDIRTAPEINKHQSESYSGLNVLEGYSIACHFMQEAVSHYQDISRRIMSPIIALSERNGVRIIEANLEIVGSDSVSVIYPESVKVIQPNEILKLRI